MFACIRARGRRRATDLIPCGSAGISINIFRVNLFVPFCFYSSHPATLLRHSLYVAVEGREKKKKERGKYPQFAFLSPFLCTQVRIRVVPTQRPTVSREGPVSFGNAAPVRPSAPNQPAQQREPDRRCGGEQNKHDAKCRRLSWGPAHRHLRLVGRGRPGWSSDHEPV